MQLILRDNSTIDLVDLNIIKHFTVLCNDRADFVTIWNKLTPENLSEVQVVDNGETILSVSNLTLIGTQTVENGDGSVTGHFYTDGGEFVNDIYAEAGRILLGRE